MMPELNSSLRVHSFSERLPQRVHQTMQVRKSHPDSKQQREVGVHHGEYVRPPFDLRELHMYYDNSPWHKACVDAIAQAVVGYRWRLRQSALLPEGAQGDDAQRKVAIKFMEECSPDVPAEEMLKAAVADYKSTGIATIEVARNKATGLPDRLFYMPTHTTLVHRTLPKVRQEDGLNTAHFWLFDAPNRTSDDNEVLRIYRPNAKSAYYGIPDHLAAVAAILGDILARDYNLKKFDSRMISDWAVSFSGKVKTEVRDAIKSHFKALIDRDDYHVPLFLEVPGGKADDVQWHRLNDEMKDASWTLYRKLSRDEILAVHRVPPNKITAFESSRLQTSPEQAEQFRDEVVTPLQRLFEHALNKVLRVLGVTDWEIELPVADLTEETKTSEIAVRLAQTGCYRVNEIRAVTGHDPLDEGGDEIVRARGADAGRSGDSPFIDQPTGREVGKRLKALEQRIAKALGDLKP